MISQPLKASTALVFASFIQKGITVLSVPLFTRLMSADAYGAFSVYSSWIEVIGLLASLCLSKGVYNNGLQDFEADRDAFSFSMLVLSNISTLCVMAVVLGVHLLYPHLLGMTGPMIAVMGLFFLFEPAYNLWRVRQRFEFKYRAQTILACTISILSTATAIIFVYVEQDDTLLARVFGFYGVSAGLYAVFFGILAIRARWHIDVSYWKYALAFNLPLIPHYLSLYVLNHFDRIMIAGFLGDSAAAMYTLAYQLGSAGVIVWSSINASLIPYTYEKCRQKDFSSLNRLTKKILALYACVCIFLIAYAPELIFVLAPSSYQESIALVAPVVAGVFCSSLYYIFANVVYYYKKPRYVMVASCISAVLNVFLNALLIPVYGIVAAAYSTIVCYAIQACIDYWAMKQVVPIKVYSMKAIVGIAVIVGLSAAFLPLTYPWTIARLTAGFLVVLAAILFRKRIRTTLTSIQK